VFKETLTGRIRLINGGRKKNCNVVLEKHLSQREWKFSLSGNVVAMTYQPQKQTNASRRNGKRIRKEKKPQRHIFFPFSNNGRRAAAGNDGSSVGSSRISSAS
jgi:hypothetical protein